MTSVTETFRGLRHARPPVATSPGQSRVGLLLVALLAPYSWLFLANSWTGDDAFISYRAGWNLLHGYGFTFNPAERVQAFTNPLWTALLALCAAFTGEFFYTAQAVSWLCGAGVLYLVARHSPHWTNAVASVLLLLSSKAFVDYLSSGLETPLTYLLVAAVVLRTLSGTERPGGEARSFGADVLLASLAYVNRPDTVLLTVPCILLRAWRVRGTLGWRLIGPAAIGAAPAVAWLAFSIVYYGFPFPNSYYAKVATGLPTSLVLAQGMAYVANSLAYDPLTLVVVAAALFSALLRRNARATVVMSSAALYVVYTISVGGDFMSGRFFALPFLQAVLVLGCLAPSPLQIAPVAAVLALYAVLNPLAPVRTRSDYEMGWPWRQQNGIKDERGGYHQGTNLLRHDPLRPLPDHVWVREGMSARSMGTRVLEHGSIGFVGYYGGPDLYLIDRNALSDPLLARMPVSDRIHFEFFSGHFFRDIPEGYRESRLTGTNQVKDPLLHELLDALTLAGKGPVLSVDRWRAIWRLNVADLSGLHARIRRTRPLNLSVRADHWRFTSDVGVRDERGGSLRSTGRGGYLQLGPGIPLDVGTYEAKWLGSIDAAPSSAIGVVEAWADGRLLGKLAVEGAQGPLAASLPFVVSGHARRVDYRFLVHEGVRVTLERIELARP